MPATGCNTGSAPGTEPRTAIPRDAASAIPRAWPFEEAARVAARLAASGKRGALFETGYGPSGLPHIGTFGEVARTTWVRRAFTELTGLPSRLLAFSDDMDGLRKVPDNVPNRDLLAGYLNRPLTRVPDPFGTHDSFGAHNNARLRGFLDSFGFDYEFASATEYYAAGRFDAALLRVLETYDAIMAVILPTLGPERRATYAPVLPIHPHTGEVMQVPLEGRDAVAGTIAWRDPISGERFETSVKGGAAKLQWKADWAMRWFALGVDYEMSGKDLIDSVRLSSRICAILGGRPPETYTYELFLDEHAQKISKSRGNGLAVEDWLRYAPAESLAQFMYNAPQRAKRLYFDVIPRATDEFTANLGKLAEQDAAARRTNPAWHILGAAAPDAPDGATGNPAAARPELTPTPTPTPTPVSFTMLLNLASVANAETPDILWGFIRRYNPAATPAALPFLDRLVQHAIAYYRDFVRPAKQFRQPTPIERAALAELAAALRDMPPDADAETIQTALYEIGKRHPFPDLRAWFGCLYQVLLGQAEGPRFGGFVSLYGIVETIALIEAALVRPADAA